MLPGGNLLISAVVGRQSCLAPERAAVKSGGGFALVFSVAAASKFNLKFSGGLGAESMTT